MLGFCPCCWPFPGGTGSPVFQRAFGGVAPFPVLLTASFSSHIHVAVYAGEEYRLCVSQTLLCLILAGLEDFLGTLSSAPHEPGASGPWVSGQWMVGHRVRARLTPGIGRTQVLVCTHSVFRCCCLAWSLAPWRGLRDLLRRDYVHTVL